ncbi:auxin efflux carrier [Neoconidiobolus thromboides FSU 785]|nr:auxin efflux carrier [Neoconidiobolus thromboides FSU 785]
MASNATLTTYLSMWPIPIVYFTLFLVCWSISKLGSKILGLPEPMRKFVTLASITSNSNSLPMSLIQSIAISSIAHHLLWDEKDTLEEIEGRGITYIVLFAAVSNIVRWSYGVTLIQNPEDKVNEIVEAGGNSYKIIDDESTPLIKNNQENTPLCQRFINFIRPVFSSIYNFFNPPLVAIFAALLVGSIPQLKGLLYGPSPIFGAVANSLKVCSGAAIPIVLIGLGCNISMLLQESRSVDFRAVGLVIVTRFFLGPLVVISLLILAQPWFYLGDDPVFVLTMMILVSTPTAINLLNVCQSVNKFEEEMSMLLLYSYILCLPIMTLLVAFYLYIIQTLPF